jgi:hypothetical protein
MGTGNYLIYLFNEDCSFCLISVQQHVHRIKVFVVVVLFVLIVVQLYEMIIVIDDPNLLNKNGVRRMLVVRHGRLLNGHLYVLKIKLDSFILMFHFSVRLHVEPVFDDVKSNVIKMVDPWINPNVHNQCLLNKRHVLH